MSEWLTPSVNKRTGERGEEKEDNMKLRRQKHQYDNKYMAHCRENDVLLRCSFDAATSTLLQHQRIWQ
jgi:hypothetical protein